MIIKFNPAGRVVMVIGRRPDPVDELTAMSGNGRRRTRTSRTRSAPDHVGWDAQGNIFVTDGYGDDRVVKFDKNGRFIKSAGTAGNGPGQLRLPHTMAMDAAGNVYIGDRSNARVQVWDNDLNPKAIYDQVGSPWAVCISPGPHQYLFVSNSVPTTAIRAPPPRRRDLQDGARRHDHRQVRQGRKGAEGVQHRARDRLP